MKINKPFKLKVRILGDVRPNPFGHEPGEPAYLVTGFKVKTLSGSDITHHLPADQVNAIKNKLLDAYADAQIEYAETRTQEKIDDLLLRPTY